MQKYRIWIVGRGTYAYNLIKAISKEKYEINLITTDTFDFAAWSNKVNKVYYSPDPNKISYYAYCNYISYLTQGDIVIPVGEESIILEKEIETNSHEINMYGLNKYPCRTFFHNKGTFYNILNELPDIPNLNFFDEMSYIDDNKVDGKEYILKSYLSRGGQDQYKITLNEPFNVPENYIMQECIKPDLEYSVFLLADCGEIKMFLAYSVNYMVDGYGTMRNIIESKIARQYCDKLIKESSYSGFMGIDFLIKDDVHYPIDCNPRVTNGIGFLKNNSFDVLNFTYEIDKDCIINTIPYIVLTKDLGKIFCSNDHFVMADIVPGIVVVITILWNILEAIFLMKTVPTYLKQKLISQIVVYKE